MGIKKSDAEFTEPFVGTTEVIVMMSVQGGRSTSSAVRLDYNAVHALEKAIVDYTFLADTPQTEETCERCVYVRGSQWCQGCNGTPKRWDGEKIVDTPQTETSKTIPLNEWLSFKEYVLEMDGEGELRIFRIIPMSEYKLQNQELHTDCGWK